MSITLFILTSHVEAGREASVLGANLRTARAAARWRCVVLNLQLGALDVSDRQLGGLVAGIA